MGSLFDGISGFPLASVRCGIEPIWASEIEPFPILLRKMEEYCQQQTGMSLHDYAQQFREEPEQQQGPVMKL